MVSQAKVHERSEPSLFGPKLVCRVCVCSSPVPNCTRNTFEGVIQRSLQSAFEDRVCLIATVRLAKPQFIKVRILISSSVLHPAFHLLRTHLLSVPVLKKGSF